MKKALLGLRWCLYVVFVARTHRVSVCKVHLMSCIGRLCNGLVVFSSNTSAHGPSLLHQVMFFAGLNRRKGMYCEMLMV